MYKKIKNGSFMNWIWFIVALLPFLLLLINCINYNNKENNYNIINNEFNFKNMTINTITNFELNENTNIFETILEPNSTIRVVQFDFQYEDNFVLYSYSNTNLTSMVQSLKLTFNDNTSQSINFSNENEYIFNINNISLNNNKTKNDINKLTITYRLTGSENDTNLSIFKTYNLLNNEQKNILLSNNYKVIQKYTNIESFLNGILKTIQTNGFISDAFLNFAQFFGVDNVYYSLACYYIEYLLVIILLHLAFDVLYILPNICHKFMEKIGGEKD